MSAAAGPLQTGDWVALLEGVCRVGVQGVQARPSGQYDVALVQQLEMKAGGGQAGPQGGGSAKAEAELAELGAQ